MKEMLTEWVGTGQGKGFWMTSWIAMFMDKYNARDCIRCVTWEFECRVCADYFGWEYQNDLQQMLKMLYDATRKLDLRINTLYQHSCAWQAI